MIILLISIMCAFLLGSIPTGFLLARLFGKGDIRKSGSGNVGATNVYRITGKLPGILTLILDIAKGAIAVSILAQFFYRWDIPLTLPHYRLLLALCAVSGHNWTPFLKFKGGKGIATSAGVLIVICPGILGIILLVWIGIFALTKIVSIASIISSIAFPIAAAILGDIYLTLFAVILCIMSVFKHRSNIGRIIRGEEKTLKL